MLLEVSIILITLIVWGYAVQRRPSKFPPGPIGLPFVGYAPFLLVKPTVTLSSLVKVYGKIFSVFVGQNPIIVINDIEDMRVAFKTNAFSGRPADKLLAMEILPDGIAYNEGPAWEEQRRFALKIFREFGFGKQGMAESFQTEVRAIVDYLRQHLNEPLNPKPILQQATVNAMILQTLVNERYPIGDQAGKDFIRMGFEGFIEPGTNGVVYFFPKLAKMFPKLTGYAKVKRQADKLYATWEKYIKEHEETLTDDNRDYVDAALKKIQATHDPTSSFFKGGKAMRHLNQLLTAFFVGGSEATSSNLTFLLLHMIENPRVMKKAQEEIDQVIGRTRTPVLQDRPNMPYMEAVLSEVLRYSSNVPWALFHSMTEDTEFGGYLFPKRTIVLSNLHYVHHDEKLWGPTVNEFRPERFLTKDGKFDSKTIENLVPFGVGKRICPSEGVAIMGFFLLACGVLQNFDPIPHPDHPLPPSDSTTMGLVISPTAYKIQFVERK